ncbi:hypothetical protein GCM10027039_01780 [Terrabacter koreensis]
MSSDDRARRLILELCPIAGDAEKVSAALLAHARTGTAEDAAILAMQALRVIFTDCLPEPVPTQTEMSHA